MEKQRIIGRVVKRNDAILIGILLLLGIITLLCYQLFGKNPGNEVVITVNGAEQARLSLDENTKYEIRDGNHLNILEIKDGYAKMIEASCPDLICLHQKKIRYRGERIICLPNKVVVSVVGEETNGIDAVAK